MFQNKKGFTLIELLVVIAIIAILSSIGIVSYSAVTSKAKDTKRQQDLKTLSQALELYANSSLGGYKGYPFTEEGGCSSYTAIKKYIHNQEIPLDPSGDEYCYFPINDGKSYRLYAKLDNCDQSNIPDKNCDQQDVYTYSITSPDLEIVAPSQEVLTYLNPQSSIGSSGEAGTQPTPTPVPSPTLNPSPSPDMSFCTICLADINTDGRVTTIDSSIVTNCINQGIDSTVGGVSCSQADLNGDGAVDNTDSSCVSSKFGQFCAQPSSSPSPSVNICTPSDVSICGTKSCGSATGVDNCGTSRTVSCGSCSTGQTCSNNTCVSACTPTDTSICGSRNCGNVTGTDNCGSSRTVNCGSSCPSGQACGSDNICAIPNLLANNGFEGSLNNWICQGAVSGTCSVNTSTKFAGTSSAVIVNTGGGWGWQLAQGGINTTGGQSEAFCLSAYVYKTSSSSVSLGLQEPVDPYRAVEVVASSSIGGWSLAKSSVTKPSIWTGNTVQVYLRNYSQNVSVYFDNVRLTRGACAS